MHDFRRQELTTWANARLRRLHSHNMPDLELQIVSGDASFRRYFRLASEHFSYIAVDAPPANENSALFVQIADLLRASGVSTPLVHAADFDQGFMLLQDFGDTLYLDPLLQAQAQGDAALPERLYRDAIATLLALQSGVDASKLPHYDRAKLRTEMALFETWFCEAFLGLQLTNTARDCIAATFQLLEDAALNQPQVAVHRDYHSRNLLVLDAAHFPAGSNPGVIDFQDAVAGAYTYDLVSLLRDCYISWDKARVDNWARSYLALAHERAMFPTISTAQFHRDFDLMGLQRNLKVMGIFSRLAIRDNKPRYLADIPLVMRYFLDVSEHYQELAPFRNWFLQTVLPVAGSKLNLDN